MVHQHSLFLAVRGRNLVVKVDSDEEKLWLLCALVLSIVDVYFAKLQLVLIAPTKEVANDIVNKLRHLKDSLRPVLCIGGSKTADNVLQIHEGAQVVVGTPGRLLFLLSMNFVPLDYVSKLVLSDTNWIFGSNMREKVARIWCFLPPKKQILCISVSYSQTLKNQLITAIPGAIFIDDDLPLDCSDFSFSQLVTNQNNEANNGSTTINFLKGEYSNFRIRFLPYNEHLMFCKKTTALHQIMRLYQVRYQQGPLPLITIFCNRPALAAALHKELSSGNFNLPGDDPIPSEEKVAVPSVPLLVSKEKPLASRQEALDRYVRANNCDDPPLTLRLQPADDTARRETDDNNDKKNDNGRDNKLCVLVGSDGDFRGLRISPSHGETAGAVVVVHFELSGDFDIYTERNSRVKSTGSGESRIITFVTPLEDLRLQHWCVDHHFETKDLTEGRLFEII